MIQPEATTGIALNALPKWKGKMKTIKIEMNVPTAKAATVRTFPIVITRISSLQNHRPMSQVNKHQAMCLKEAGYDVPATEFYNQHGEKPHDTSSLKFNWNKNTEDFKNTCSAPMLSDAAEWLRESKGLHVGIIPEKLRGGWFYAVSTFQEEGWSLPDISTSYYTHDDALSAGIDKCLEILKERNQ